MLLECSSVDCENDCSYSTTPLTSACAEGHLECVLLLLLYGASMTGIETCLTPLGAAAAGGCVSAFHQTQGDPLSDPVKFFSKLNLKYIFLDTLIPKIYILIIKINNFRGDLSNISAKMSTLVRSSIFIVYCPQNRVRRTMSIISVLKKNRLADIVIYSFWMQDTSQPMLPFSKRFFFFLIL